MNAFARFSLALPKPRPPAVEPAIAKPGPVLHVSSVTGRKPAASFHPKPPAPAATLPTPSVAAPPEPFDRVWVAKGRVREFVILDQAVGPTVIEHQWRNPATGRCDQYERCAQLTGNCPLCENTEFFGTAKASRKLTCYAVDRANAREPRALLSVGRLAFYNLIMAAAEEHGSLAGLCLRLTREADDPSPTGRPEITGILSLGELRRAEPYDYAALFPPVTPAGLRARYGGAAPVGSLDDILAELTDGESSLL
jgi:hypothetical protein